MRVIAHVDMDAFYTQGTTSCFTLASMLALQATATAACSTMQPFAIAAAAAAAATSQTLDSEYGSMQPQAAIITQLSTATPDGRVPTAACSTYKHVCCAVELRRDRDRLAGQPVVVTQYNPFGDLSTLRPEEDRIKPDSNGSIIAVGYEARAFGVKR